MKLNFNQQLADNYKSNSQIARVLTENWVDNEIYCPNCGLSKINKYLNNNPVGDFYCLNCKEDYELKSSKQLFSSKVNDGAYHTMLERLKSINNPNFFLLNYDLVNLEVRNFFVIPKHFFTPEIIEKRNPLALTAERHDWVGCNILLKNIPETGKIFFVRDKQIKSKEKVLAEWQKTLFLREEKEMSAKGWLLDVMRCVDKISKKEFTLNEIYVFENELSRLHPENKHIKDKIRQQLQFLRDKDYLKFTSRGNYQLT